MSPRFQARGYGFENPIAPNTTDENRARNRRVQFIILERDVAETEGEVIQDASEDPTNPTGTGQETESASGDGEADG